MPGRGGILNLEPGVRVYYDGKACTGSARAHYTHIGNKEAPGFVNFPEKYPPVFAELPEGQVQGAACARFSSPVQGLFLQLA